MKNDIVTWMIILIPFLGISQNYKLVNESYPEIVMKKIENDTVSAKLITSKAIVDGYVVYRQIKRLDIDKLYRFPESFLGNNMKLEKDVLYYESEKIYDTGITYYNGYNVQLDGITTVPNNELDIHWNELIIENQ
jgi:hypothetical protein